MTLTPEQFNKLAAKEDLQDFATKIVKLDNIEHAFVSNLAAHDRV